MSELAELVSAAIDADDERKRVIAACECLSLPGLRKPAAVEDAERKCTRAIGELLVHLEVKRNTRINPEATYLQRVLKVTRHHDGALTLEPQTLFQPAAAVATLNVVEEKTGA